MLMSRLRTDGRTDGNVKVEQYSAEAESAIKCLFVFICLQSLSQLCKQFSQVPRSDTTSLYYYTAPFIQEDLGQK